MNLLNSEILYSIGKDRGYYSKQDLCNAIATLLDKTPQTVYQQISSRRDFSIEQAARIGFLLEMTPKEFCDTFLSGLFIETPSGSFRVRDLYSMKPQPTVVKKKRRIQANRDRLKQERDID